MKKNKKPKSKKSKKHPNGRMVESRYGGVNIKK